MREDILRSYPSVDPEVKVVHNGIDLYLWQRERDEDVVRSHGMDPDRPSVASSAGSRARRVCPTCCAPPLSLPPDVQLVLPKPAPPTRPRSRRRWAPHRRPASDA